MPDAVNAAQQFTLSHQFGRETPHSTRKVALFILQPVETKNMDFSIELDQWQCSPSPKMVQDLHWKHNGCSAYFAGPAVSDSAGVAGGIVDSSRFQRAGSLPAGAHRLLETRQAGRASSRPVRRKTSYSNRALEQYSFTKATLVGAVHAMDGEDVWIRKETKLNL